MDQDRINLKVRAIRWEVMNNIENIMIHCWAIDTDRQIHLLKIEDFPIICYIELPCYVNFQYHNWNRFEVDDFMRSLFHHCKLEPKRYFFSYRKKLYSYDNNNNYPMLTVILNKISDIEVIQQILNNPLKLDRWNIIKCRLHESNPIDMLLAVRGLGTAQWFQVQATYVPKESKITTLEQEYNIKIDDIHPINILDPIHKDLLVDIRKNNIQQ